jgi:hypothetical protein
MISFSGCFVQIYERNHTQSKKEQSLTGAERTGRNRLVQQTHVCAGTSPNVFTHRHAEQVVSFQGSAMNLSGLFGFSAGWLIQLRAAISVAMDASLRTES